MRTKGDFLGLVIKAQKAGKDVSGLMRLFKAGLNQEEIDLVNAYLAALPEGDALELMHYYMR